MGSTKLSDDLSSEMKARRDCLETAKKILLADGDYGDFRNIISIDNDISQAYIYSLVNLHDSLQETLSKSSSTPTSPMALIYSQFHRLKWPAGGDRNENECADDDIDTETIRDLFGLEADLYRAMWLTCLILISVINTSNDNREQQQRGRKRSRRELNDPTSGDGGNRKILLQRTVDQCAVLVQLLGIVEFGRGSNAAYSGHTAPNDHGENNVWDERIREWTTDSKNEAEDDDDNSLNILSFTKEQLEQEEQELLNMAETPIPSVDSSNQQQQQHKKQSTTWNKSSNGNANAIETIELLRGTLTATSAETLSSSSPILVQLDGRGVLRASEGATNSNESADDNKDKDRWWWSLTPQSVVYANDNGSPNKIQINNVISICTAKLTTITLDVGQDSIILWLEQVSSIQANAKRNDGNEKLVAKQEEIKRLWTADKVITAKRKANELFVGKIRKGR